MIAESWNGMPIIFRGKQPHQLLLYVFQSGLTCLSLLSHIQNSDLPWEEKLLPPARKSQDCRSSSWPEVTFILWSKSYAQADHWMSRWRSQIGNTSGLFEVHLFALARHFSQGLKEHIQKCLWDNNNNKITAVMIVIIPIDNLKIKLTPWCFTAINSQNKAQCRDGYGLGAQWAVWDRSLCFSISITR